MKTRPQIKVVAEKIVQSNPSLQRSMLTVLLYGMAVEALLARATFNVSGNLEDWYISG
jgi:hypothetical protein